MKNLKRFALALVAAGAFFCTACTETPPPDDSNLPASGAPQSWETSMPGMSGLVPDDR